MVSFWVYDVSFMILFSFAIFLFLRSRRHELAREGIIFMWRTQFGVKAINYVGDNFNRFLHRIKYVIVGVGVILMGAMIWMLGQTVIVYIMYPQITKLIKAPPIAPLIPYFPKLFGMESFFPDFYFTYFIIALAIVAIAHEFSHGVFMRLFKVKIKSTGLVFLGPILGAFVEEEKTGFHKKRKLEQMTVLGAGVFANAIFALIFYGLYVGFFFSSFTASGYIFNSYGIAAIPTGQITGYEKFENLTRVLTSNGNYYLDDGLAVQLFNESSKYIIAYPEAPAVLAGMRGAIIVADDVKITGQDKLREFLENKHPGEPVKFATEDNGEVFEYDIILGEHPDDSNRAYLGVGHNIAEPKGIIQKFLIKFMSFKDSSTLYKPTWNVELVYFIYYLLWWIMIINLLVALFNMLPIGMLDGGRFFFLAVLGISRSEKVAKLAYKIAGYLILLVIVLMMFFWFVRII